MGCGSMHRPASDKGNAIFTYACYVYKHEERCTSIHELLTRVTLGGRNGGRSKRGKLNFPFIWLYNFFKSCPKNDAFFYNWKKSNTKQWTGRLAWLTQNCKMGKLLILSIYFYLTVSRKLVKDSSIFLPIHPSTHLTNKPVLGNGGLRVHSLGIS